MAMAVIYIVIVIMAIVCSGEKAGNDVRGEIALNNTATPDILSLSVEESNNVENSTNTTVNDQVGEKAGDNKIKGIAQSIKNNIGIPDETFGGEKSNNVEDTTNTTVNNQGSKFSGIYNDDNNQLNKGKRETGDQGNDENTTKLFNEDSTVAILKETSPTDEIPQRRGGIQTIVGTLLKSDTTENPKNLVTSTEYPKTKSPHRLRLVGTHTTDSKTASIQSRSSSRSSTRQSDKTNCNESNVSDNKSQEESNNGQPAESNVFSVIENKNVTTNISLSGTNNMSTTVSTFPKSTTPVRLINIIPLNTPVPTNSTAKPPKEADSGRWKKVLDIFGQITCVFTVVGGALYLIYSVM